ncbi:hypothetical protein NC797_02525 [Aquibacillus sp. 3ASR75-11]|uniref:Uncharacterized protein n=1 Tax=Terrihalobacillus insolitus TaxID=2950438 RepID=A0A9X3WSC4_9BACI|nr:hypothetical protein [Terrihalobacillus insolitus]MDC3411932.1 hypothetical protein [Terrihalobacillus insolitus]MDC3423381.1 hypothetical protein [Terrihalobacillus insolitus]
MQEFMEDGNLFPGIHTYSCEEFEEQFVTMFTTSSTRSRIYKSLKEWLKLLVDILPPRYIWLDGSYLTTKMDPNDIDLVVFYRPEDIVTLGQDKTKQLGMLINQLSINYNCDAYFCYTLDHLSQEVVAANFKGQEKIMQTYWMGQFCFDRSRKPKGIIEFKKEVIEKMLGGVKNDVASRKS